MGAGCSDWFCRGDRSVYHRVDHFSYQPHATASITSYAEYSVDPVDHLTRRLTRSHLCRKNTLIRIACSRACRMGFLKLWSPRGGRCCSSLVKRRGTNERTLLAETAFLSKPGKHSVTLKRRWRRLAAR